MSSVSFTEAKAVLTDDEIIYDVDVGRMNGDLMTYKRFREDCDDGHFIDYDGFGNALDADGNDLGSISPSEGNKYPTALYVLWYNR